MKTFGSTGVARGTDVMFCLSAPNRSQGLCIYVDETDKWEDFKNKIYHASGIPIEDQIILVLGKRRNTIQDLDGWQSENGGFTRVIDARMIRKGNRARQRQ
jgi:hypothetical protein